MYGHSLEEQKWLGEGVSYKGFQMPPKIDWQGRGSKADQIALGI